MNFDKESISETKKKKKKKKHADGGGGGDGGGRWNTETKTQNSMPDCQERLNTKQQPFTQCKACGTINIRKYVNNF